MYRVVTGVGDDCSAADGDSISPVVYGVGGVWLETRGTPAVVTIVKGVVTTGVEVE